MAGRQIDSAKRNEIKEKIREGIISRKTLAEQYQVSLPTIHNIAKEVRGEAPNLPTPPPKSKPSALSLLQSELESFKKELAKLEEAAAQIEKLKAQISKKEEALKLLEESENA